MPLKHSTETALVLLLGLALLLTGMAMRLLPPLPGGIVLFGAAILASLLYPIALYPLMKRRRAEYSFRALHFVPFLMLGGWLGLELARFYGAPIADAQLWYEWGFGLPAVVVGFLLLMGYCRQVIRQRSSRLTVLVFLLAPFVVLGAVGESQRWSDQAAALVAGVRVNDIFDSGSFVSGRIANLLPSPDESEEQWRMQLRRMDRRERRLDARADEVASSAERLKRIGTVTKESVLIAAETLQKPKKEEKTVTIAPKPPRATVEAPPRLPSSGPGVEVLVLTMLAGYSGLLHARARRPRS